MKNTKLIALVAVLVVITLVVSIVVATSNDEKVAKDLEQQVSSYEDKIASLNKIIDDLNKGLVSAEEALEALNKAGVELKEWNEATVALPQQLINLKAAAVAFHNAAVVVDPTFKGELSYDIKGCIDANLIVNFNALYNYKNGDANVIDQFTTIYDEAYNDLLRATTVAEMQSIVKGLTASYEAIPTSIEALRTAITEAEKNGVTYDDYANIKLATYLTRTFVVDDDLYNKDEKKDLADRLAALYVDFAPVVLAKYQELAAALPEVEQVAPSHYEQVEKATAEGEFVKFIWTEVHGAQASAKLNALLTKKNGKDTDLGKAVKLHKAVVARVLVVKQIEAHANAVNKVLADAFKNETVDRFDETKYGANLYTHKYIYETLWADIDYWERINNIITDEKDEDYNEELHNLVNYEVYEGYKADFQVVVEVLREAADKFIDAVAAIEKITPDSKDELNAAKALFDAAAKLMKKEDLDIILNYVDYVDEDGDDVEINGVVDSWYTMLKLRADYDWLVAAIATLENDVKDSLVKCTNETHGKLDANGNVVVCNCKQQALEITAGGVKVLAEYKVGEYNLHTIGNHDANIIKILGNYDLDESVFDADLLAVYKVARLLPYINTARKNVETAKKASTLDAELSDALANYLNEEIDEISANYTFAVELVCTCPENSTDPCECDTYKMAIVDDPAKTLTEKYAVDYLLNNRFDVQEAE
jgi:exonuclease VII small subunit